ncbi:gamma-glutamyl-gamma-aminobutyrate hydrolase family protein [Halanaerobiaceae bacterium Z-7014]|uniref:Gamma-glutamyl-gamma-aminobutyrate hydrolase family protein n=1 Tax=Halonatronomonas betaini TaxID=2778430 RepID=A0A931AMF4_9FIRM|nr:gamma-glutamyl-gamma-aminobutyrate hydrolase family protein [Halonatronomonas betaini]MBF8435483.1 gamma-glutamyl-gamma-aminobutyrate hydrolase family protein [Halonatronomonas betaini]
MIPTILVTSYYVFNQELDEDKRVRGFPTQDMVMCTVDYLNGIKAGGGMPFIISPINDEEYIASALERCDGVLLTGGGDIDPELYQENKLDTCMLVNNFRDEFELKVLDMALKSNKPILGICRGLQLINVYYGGSIYQNIDLLKLPVEHFNLNKGKDYKAHQVEVYQDSHLYQALQKEKIKTNSLHHQAINQLGDGVSVIAKSEDGLIEGIEVKDKEMTFAVQWHPEMMFKKSNEQKQIFTYFIDYIKKLSN